MDMQGTIGFGCYTFDYLHFEGYSELICDLIWQDISKDRTGTWKEGEEKEVAILRSLAMNELGQHDRKQRAGRNIGVQRAKGKREPESDGGQPPRLVSFTRAGESIHP